MALTGSVKCSCIKLSKFVVHPAPCPVTLGSPSPLLSGPAVAPALSHVAMHQATHTAVPACTPSSMSTTYRLAIAE